jgi:hypothetical protein
MPIMGSQNETAIGIDPEMKFSEIEGGVILEL